MNDKTLRRIMSVGLDASDFTRKGSMESRITALEAEVTALKSYVNSIGKTVLEGDGSAETPFAWADGIDLIPNAFYNVDGVRYVYMGSAAIASDINKPTGDSDADFGNGWTHF